MENFNTYGCQKCQNEIMTCRIVSVVLNLSTTTYKWVNCKCPVLLDECFATFTNCSAVMIKIYCMKDNKVKCFAIDQNSKSKKNILISLEFLQSITKKSVQNEMVVMVVVVTRESGE